MAMGAGKRGRRGFGIAGRPRGGGSMLGFGASSSISMGNAGAGHAGAASAAAAAAAGTPGKDGFTTKPGQNLAEKRRSGEVRRRGRQPKIREMVGLSVSWLPE